MNTQSVSLINVFSDTPDAPDIDLFKEILQNGREGRAFTQG